PLALVSGHYRCVLIACDHARLDFRSNAVGAASAAVLGALSIPWQGAMSAAAALLVAAFVILLLAHAATRERGVVLLSIARVLPACSAVVAAGLAARGLWGFGSWAAAAGAAAMYLSLLVLVEFWRPLRWRVRPVGPEPAAS